MAGPPVLCMPSQQQVIVLRYLEGLTNAEVGRVHLGVVHLFDVERPAVQPRETDLLETGFRPVPEILADLEGFETWSAICLKALFESGE